VSDTESTPADDAARENAHEGGDEVLAAAAERFPDVVGCESLGQAVAYVPRESWRPFAQWLRDEQQFETCVDVCAVDHLLNRSRHVPPGVSPERLEVVANFLSRARNRRLRAICEVPIAEPTVPSLAPVFAGADWPERETYDLFGVVFADHPDLTRILLPDDWAGHPLRKDDAAARVPVQFKGPRATPSQQSLERDATGETASR